MAPPIKYLKNIIIGGDSSAYQREVARYLDLIRTTEIGRALVKHINFRATQMTIVPFKPTASNPVNASANPANPADAMPEGYQGAGTGSGSAVTVEYHPATFRQLNQNMGRIAPGGGPGEALFHEMVHGYRQQRGQALNIDKFGTEPAEEFYAVLASNVYRSERGFTRFRAAWSSRFAPLADSLSDSELYYDEFKGPIDQWFVSDRGFCLDAANANARFNPFRAAAVAVGLLKSPGVSMRLP
ncbi:MAG: M91 family zinc metallopeptidase [Hyphomicrobiales bacterium]